MKTIAEVLADAKAEYDRLSVQIKEIFERNRKLRRMADAIENEWEYVEEEPLP
jgi:hypothetical protein